MALRAVRWVQISLGLLLLAVGCSRTTPYLEPIEARTPIAFSLWRSRAHGTLTADEWRWFDQVMQEHKYEIMRVGKVTGSAAIDEAARQIVHGRPLSEIMREGLQMILRRKTAELDEMSTAFNINARKVRLIKADDTQLRYDLAHHQDELRKRISLHELDIARLRTAYAIFEAKAGR